MNVSANELREVDLRNALHERILKAHHNNPKTLIIEELGLEHGASRVDVAVINGHIHGFEIKAQTDRLTRLPRQIKFYSKIMDFSSLVTVEKFHCPALRILPPEWGLIIATYGKNGALRLSRERAPTANKAVDAYAVAQLLWRPEAIEVLRGHGLYGGTLRQRREALYCLLVEIIPLDRLKPIVRNALRARANWRGPRPSS